MFNWVYVYGVYDLYDLSNRIVHDHLHNISQQITSDLHKPHLHSQPGQQHRTASVCQNSPDGRQVSGDGDEVVWVVHHHIHPPHSHCQLWR